MLTSPLFAYWTSGISTDAVLRVSAPIVSLAMRASAATCLLIAGSLLAAGCGHKAADQRLRTCVDRWNQGNMAGWEPAAVNVAYRRPVARERASIALPARRRCIVSVDAGGGTWTCVLADRGAYWCPPRHEPTGPPLTNRNGGI